MLSSAPIARASPPCVVSSRLVLSMTAGMPLDLVYPATGMRNWLPDPFLRLSVRHDRSYVKSLYRRYLANELDWYIRRDAWRQRAMEIRAEFERNR